MQLSRKSIESVKNAEIPGPDNFSLPEKILQFGTGVLLRGLPDYFVDKANKQSVFGGRIVVVKSTGDDVSEFDRQDSLFTHCIYGIRDGESITQHVVNGAVSRVLSAGTHWDEILQCAANPHLQIVVSNTTEVGIVYVKDAVHGTPPVSFPGKLLAFLYERYSVFNGAGDKGMVIVPTELITENGTKLKNILIRLAMENELGEAFVEWLTTSNCFCNSLVDRIVPGKLPAPLKKSIETKLGIEDDLMIISEPYTLWAIETGDSRVKEILSFYKTDSGVVIVPDITVYRELKLRLLNGTHTFSCGLAYLAGFDTVKEAMDDQSFVTYMKTLMSEEILPAITSSELLPQAASSFASAVLDRFRNPFIEHRWLNITLQYSSKMAMRNVPVIIEHMQRSGQSPTCMAKGFAAHILFMRCRKEEDGKYHGQRNGDAYLVSDDNAAFYAACWEQEDVEEVVSLVLGRKEIWGTDLLALEGFSGEVSAFLQLMILDGAAAAIRLMGNEKIKL